VIFVKPSTPFHSEIIHNIWNMGISGANSFKSYGSRGNLVDLVLINV